MMKSEMGGWRSPSGGGVGESVVVGGQVVVVELVDGRFRYMTMNSDWFLPLQIGR